MTRLRTLLVTSVLVVLALAAGVAVGGGTLGPVGGAVPEPRDPSPGAEADEATTRSLAHADRLVGTAAGQVYGDRLANRPVAVLTLPGVPQELVDRVNRHVRLAGGRVAATYPAPAGLLDTSEQGLVETLGEELTKDVRQGIVGDNATGHVRIGQLLGRAIASRREGAMPVDEHARTIRRGLAAADLLQVPQGTVRRAPLVLVLLPPTEDGTSDATGDAQTGRSATAVLGRLLGGLSTRAGGVVVAGDTASGLDGRISALRESEFGGNVATVDGIDRNAGRATAILALLATLRGEGGAYGASGSDGTPPLG